MAENTRNRGIGRLAVVVAALAVGSAAASSHAENVSIMADQLATPQSSFTLDFGPELGGPRTALISQTDFAMAIDPVAGTAAIQNYYQQVESLNILGLETGALTIRVVPGTSTGTFDSATGQFSTSELYEIHFEGDLSAIGFESPVYLPSASVGTLSAALDEVGEINLNWDGEFMIPNPLNPQELIAMTYACIVNSQYRAVTPGDINRDGAVNMVDFSQFSGCFNVTGPVAGGCPAAAYVSSDIDGSGRVDLNDYAVFAVNFGM